MLVTAVAVGTRAHVAAQAGFAGPHRPAHGANQQEHAGATLPAAGAAVLDSKGSHSVVGLARGRQCAQECILVSCCSALGGTRLDSKHMQAHHALYQSLYVIIATHHIASLLPKLLSGCLYQQRHIYLSLCSNRLAFCCTWLQENLVLVPTQAMQMLKLTACAAAAS